MDIQGQDGNIYKIDGTKVYIIEFRRPVVYLGLFLLVCFTILFIYDVVKDGMRVMSGYNNILRGNGVKGGTMVMGYTTGNLQRGIGLAVLILLIVGLGFFSTYSRLLNDDEIPDDIRARLQTLN